MLDNGGFDLREFVKRNMKYVMGHELARQFNVTGQRQKRAFKPLQLFEALYGMIYYFTTSINFDSVVLLCKYIWSTRYM